MVGPAPAPTTPESPDRQRLRCDLFALLLEYASALNLPQLSWTLPLIRPTDSLLRITGEVDRALSGPAARQTLQRWADALAAHPDYHEFAWIPQIAPEAATCIGVLFERRLGAGLVCKVWIDAAVARPERGER